MCKSIPLTQGREGSREPFVLVLDCVYIVKFLSKPNLCSVEWKPSTLTCNDSNSNFVAGIQVRQTKMKDATTQCRLLSTRIPTASTPPSKRSRLDVDSESPLPSTAETDSTYNIEDDFSLPNTAASTTSSALDYQLPIQHENKYIIFQSALWQLFQDCPVCQSKCSIQSSTQGSFLRVHQECINTRCLFQRQWDSQPMVKNTPAGNLLISAAILFCGASYTKSLRILNTMGVVSISSSTFKKHSREYLQPTVYRVWKGEQDSQLNRLSSMSGKPEVGGDGRADSPGHSAKYGSYTTIELRINKIIDLQLVQSNEVGGSYHMELAGLERSVAFLAEKGLTPGIMVTDRHPSVQKWVRENLPDTTQYYDVWHVAKGLTKKLESLAKQRDCLLIREWIRGISNHLYWCAASSAGQSGDVIAAKWLSIVRHIQNIHDGHSDLFPTCAHAELDYERKWFKPHTLAFEKLSTLLTNTRLVNDVKKLSPLRQTSSVEAFHSLIIQFAPKSVAFSFKGMLTRLNLAALHYNENSDRRQAHNKQGLPVHFLRFPKYRKGGFTVQNVKESATFRYVSDLMEFLMIQTMADPTEVWELWDEVEEPPSLCSAFQRPNMDEAIASHTTRFATSHTQSVGEEE